MKSHPLFEKKRIFAPGPTPVPQEVLSELAKPPLHHRTKEFIAIFERVKKNLQFLFQTTQPAYVLAASGTGAMEATVVNLFASGDKVLVLNGGKFGERFMKLAQRFGLDTQVMTLEWGTSADPEEIRKFLKANPDTRGVLFQASETSTATEHPVEAIAKVVHETSDALVVVDAITALGVVDLPLDKWGLDAVVSGSQKALMLPPGLAFLALSERGQKARARANIPRFYYDLAAEDKAALKGETAWTPAVGLIMALDVVLAKVANTGLQPIFQFHRRLAEGTRRGTSALGLELFSKGIPSTAVTAVHVPSAIPEGKKIVSHLRDRYGITIAGGQDAWTGKIFRLAHLGHYDELDMLQIMSAVELTLNKLGYRCEYGKGVAAVASYFAEND
jgi:serine---pyruvate transaminase